MESVRLSESSDISQLKTIWKACFNDSNNYIDWFFSHKYTPNRSVVITDAGTLIACGFLVDYKLCFHNNVFYTPYIVGVATLPEYRNKGYAAKIMVELLLMLQKEHTPLAILNPFSHDFYRKFDFITYTFLEEVTQSNGVVIDKIPFDFSLIQSIYNDNAKRFDSVILRDDYFWGRLLDEYKCDNGEVDVTANGYCLRHEHNVDELVVVKGSEQELLCAFNLSKALKHVTFTPGMLEGNMVRIIDINSFLKGYVFDKAINLHVVLAIHDSLCLCNHATFELDISCGQAQLTRVNYTPELMVTISELTQFLFGIAPLEHDKENRLNCIFKRMVHLGFEKF